MDSNKKDKPDWPRNPTNDHLTVNHLGQKLEKKAFTVNHLEQSLGEQGSGTNTQAHEQGSGTNTQTQQGGGDTSQKKE